MWPNPQFRADLVTFTEEILHEKLTLLQRKALLHCSVTHTFLKKILTAPRSLHRLIIVDERASLNQCLSLYFMSIFNLKQLRNLAMRHFLFFPTLSQYY